MNTEMEKSMLRSFLYSNPMSFGVMSLNQQAQGIQNQCDQIYQVRKYLATLKNVKINQNM